MITTTSDNIYPPLKGAIMRKVIFPTRPLQEARMFWDGYDKLRLAMDDPVLLCRTHVAGTSHLEDLDKVLEEIWPGNWVNLVREPENKYDCNAIRVESENELKLGYVPKKQSENLSAILNLGVQLYGRIASIDYEVSWTRIELEIYASGLSDEHIRDAVKRGGYE